jgi:hypothetical protein
MLQPVLINPFRSIDELFDSNYKIEWLEEFDFLYDDNQKYQNAVKEKRVIDMRNSLKQETWVEMFVAQKIATAGPCKTFTDLAGDEKTWKGFYQISEIFMLYREILFIAPFHPFSETFQQLMDSSFEAGLPMAWERKFKEFASKFKKPKINPKASDGNILDFGAILPFFLILVFGFLIALFAFLCEIFYHDFLNNLSKEYFKRKFDKFFRRGFKVRKT